MPAQKVRSTVFPEFAGIHGFFLQLTKAWMAGAGPAMTREETQHD